MPGRPTKYSAKVQEKADWYLEEGYQTHDHVVPSVVGLAYGLRVSRSTLYLWAEKHEAFSDTLERIEQKQQLMALAGGLKNEFNAAITKLLLHNHGYSDKATQEISGPNGGPITTRNASELTDDQLAAIAATGSR